METSCSAKHGRDGGQHPGDVGDLERDVVAGDHVADRADRARRVAGLARPGCAADPVPGHGDQVTEHGAGGRRAAGTRAVEHQPTRGPRTRRTPRCTPRRPRPAGDCAGSSPGAPGRTRCAVRRVGLVCELADRQQLDDAADLAGRGDVGGGDVGDALAVDVGRGHPGVEGQAGQDRRLGRGVEALDVGGRVGLRVAERLSLGQGLGEAGALGVHLVQDEVGGAVDDADHRR